MFQQQIGRLDAGGWNIDGRCHSGSLLRARMMVALVRDEILEIGLSPQEGHSTADITYDFTFSFVTSTLKHAKTSF